MTEIDLSRLEKKIIVRNMRLDDVDEIVELANLAYGIPGVAFRKEQYESQVRIFPEGQFCVEYDGKIVGSCSSLIVNFDEYGEDHTLAEISGDGFIRNHNPNGINLYGIEVVVHPEYRHMKIGRRLYEARRKLCRKLNLKSIVFGGRMPNYHKYADKLTPEEYVEQVIKKKIYDPVITFQLMNGFVFRKVMPNYLPADHESCQNATLMEWHNEDYLPRSTYQAGNYRRSLPVRISSVQYLMKPVSSFDEFAIQCEYHIRAASHIRSDFIVFPEGFTMQLASCSQEKNWSKQVERLSEHTAAYIALFSELAVKFSVNIIGGSHYLLEKDSLYNVAFLFRRDGTIDKQYKLHIPSAERKWQGVQGGDDARVFDTDCGKIAILIGYDIHFPELGRIAAEQGAQMIFTPFAADNQQSYWRIRYCAQARAIENQVFVVTSAAVGNLNYIPQVQEQYGQSGIYSPCDFSFPSTGIVAECEPNTKTMVTGEVDLEILRRNREIGSVTPLKDRRIQIYEVYTR
ncbi:putative amidohydrolase/ribosomal protein S18 acetylase RimI-like enzyme [Caldalkalibacillus uzonensis]|uniref:Amidohydrolase/ribosomal protein S18 acetylase RimI-like enzyme n=1 Tax=Caldalkalibacillus uzonensis TaxID=353224 RepID=A0ABU0CN10_9BACI|nr:bifunctional GNAT family N-acetyltransferase/carbon-nitrogen hydrolase family protein [Caldalkalibacillus uzonensis]MDQ0337807.1 putative amidohydrolase/ribosomal protein S18 acetylase RimI-like enzyme [Caldalkalibacillus uzonensis]